MMILRSVVLPFWIFRPFQKGLDGQLSSPAGKKRVQQPSAGFYSYFPLQSHKKT